MMTQPIFSIVIPAFNRAYLILPVLESVKQQTFSDFECIIVDDGSKDAAKLKQVVQGLDDPRFRYIYQNNGGGGAARNTGIDAACGRFIALLDSDDYFLPTKLEQDFLFLNAQKLETVAVFSQVLVDRGVGKFWVKPRRGPRVDENISEYLTCAQGFVPTSSLVVPREIATRVRYDETLPFGQDTDFAMRLAASGTIIKMMEKPLVVVNDTDRSGRISLQRKYLPSLQWTERARTDIMTQRAYLAYRGWHVARLAAPFDAKLAYRLYFKALFSGALPPRLALRAISQIIIPVNFYRRLADTVAQIAGQR